MVRLDVLRLLEERGKSKYWLAKQLGMSYQNLSKMVNNENQSIRYERIEALCQVLECSIEELFEMNLEEPESKSKKGTK